MKKKRAVVAMSGGVDSSVVAAMINDQGYETIGVTLQLYDYGDVCNVKQKSCCASRDIFDAKDVCQKIEIKHYTMNYESLFKEEVIDNFIDSYLAGYTPIPCVQCNQTVKFRDLYKIAKDLKADFLATGHYVQRVEKNGRIEIHKGLDPKKDQSYFLFSTTKEQLDYLRFPLGGNTKEQTRQLAEKYDLSIKDKPDSQDICFVPNGDYKKVIEKHRPNSLKTGDIIDYHTGKVLGQHNGIAGYTIGQRKGLGISADKPKFVIKTDPTKNIIYLGNSEDLAKTRFAISSCNFLLDSNEDIDNMNLKVRTRSMMQEVPVESVETQEDGKIIVNLKENCRAITPGQACVFYEGDRMIGGGWIERQ